MESQGGSHAPAVPGLVLHVGGPVEDLGVELSHHLRLRRSDHHVVEAQVCHGNSLLSSCTFIRLPYDMCLQPDTAKSPWSGGRHMRNGGTASMPIVEVNGIDLYYEEHGSGTPIVV